MISLPKTMCCCAAKHQSMPFCYMSNHPWCMRMQVRTAVTKSGCKMADSGSVLFNFQRQGLLFVPTSFGEDEARPSLGMRPHVFPHGTDWVPTRCALSVPCACPQHQRAMRNMMQASRTCDLS